MSKDTSRKTAGLAVGAAAVAVATLMIRVPVPQTRGYINLGDTMVLLFAVLLGPVVGGAAGGIGSALADVIGGYPHWAPWTLIIKGIEGAIAGQIAKKKSFFLIIGTCLGAVEMVLGYFLVESYLYGVGAALVELPGNVVQAISGIVFSNLVYVALSKLGLSFS
ncbi:MAG: ECF transporter S component [Thermoproteota archaeon]|nr:MAG: ECF transporter S component [Candidatus Korarchaeota archaeon]